MWKNQPQYTKSLAQRKESEQEHKFKAFTKAEPKRKKKKALKKGKDKGKMTAPMSTNVFEMDGISELSVVSMESINFSCYDWSETVEWFLDSGSTEHITPFKSDFVQYREFGQKQYAEITDRKHLILEGFGTVIGHSMMPGYTAKIKI